MYIPPLYKNNNAAEVRDFITQNSFGILINQAAGQLSATHIPLELDINENGQDILTGHISKGNLQWKNFINDAEVLAIFPGPHSYISSSWYDHENVPTWNYIAVHVYGKIKIIEGEKLIGALTKLVHKYEAGSEKPVSVENMSAGFFTKQINGIVGFEIEITDIQPAYKLSQNRDAVNHTNITAALEKKADYNSLAIAAEMKKHQRK
ncbi:MAG: FMN-binding negative transcriptional regulator [Chitinophagaceae bacterium]